MLVFRPLPFVLSAALLVGTAAVALANPPLPSPSGGHRSLFSEQASHAEDRGVYNGTVSDVDYSKGTLQMDSQKGHVAITVLPSTSIFSNHGGYAALTDVARGAHVEVLCSEIDGRLVAQVIRIK